MPILYQDQQLQEFLDGGEHCHHFINQDLTFLQLSTIYHMTENDQSQEVDSTPAFTSATALPEDFVCTDNDHTPIQSVEPLLIQPVEQRQREEDPNLTINELL